MARLPKGKLVHAVVPTTLNTIRATVCTMGLGNNIACDATKIVQRDGVVPCAIAETLRAVPMAITNLTVSLRAKDVAVVAVVVPNITHIALCARPIPICCVGGATALVAKDIIGCIQYWDTLTVATARGATRTCNFTNLTSVT